PARPRRPRGQTVERGSEALVRSDRGVRGRTALGSPVLGGVIDVLTGGLGTSCGAGVCAGGRRGLIAGCGLAGVRVLAAGLGQAASSDLLGIIDHVDLRVDTELLGTLPSRPVEDEREQPAEEQPAGAE